MNKIRCIVADDEPNALALMQQYVSQTPSLHLVVACHSALEVLQVLETENVDLLFLDIQMPNLSGLALAKTLPEHIKVIFTTAFEQYAIDGYKVSALDYLLKPFTYEDFLGAIQKYSRIQQKEHPIQPSDKYLMIKADYKLYQVAIDDILYIEGVKDYVRIYRQNTKEVLMSLIGLKSIEEKLPSNQFFRVHRSYIVNTHNIQFIEKGQIVFPNVRITISDQYKEDFLSFIKARFME